MTIIIKVRLSTLLPNDDFILPNVETPSLTFGTDSGVNGIFNF